MSGEGEEENMRAEDPDSSLSLRMTGWGLGMTERVHVRRRDAIQSVYRWMPAHMSGEGEEENMRI